MTWILHRPKCAHISTCFIYKAVDKALNDIEIQADAAEKRVVVD